MMERKQVITGTSDIRLTDEQCQAIDIFKSEQSLKLNAFAGAGKTSTLRAMAMSSRRRGVYVAFNRAIADYAAKSFPSFVSCRTIHSLAYRAVASRFPAAEKLTQAMNRYRVDQILSLREMSFGKVAVTRLEIASLVLACLQRFSASADRTISPSHVPHWGVLGSLAPKQLRQVSKYVVERAKELWKKMISPNDDTPLGHDGYLKLWALSDPVLESDFIMLDEAQDANAVMLGVLGRQQCQMVYVGDRHQQIYEWRGAVNAMESVETEREAYLTHSFRFGQEIANCANGVLRELGETRLVLGAGPGQAPKKASRSRALLSRSNASVIATLFETLKANQRPYIEGGTVELERLLDGVGKLQAGTRSEHPELFGFKDWREVMEFSKTEEGQEYRKLVNLVTAHKVAELRNALKQVEQSPETSTVTLSTTHKAKGREWDRVELTDDFHVPQKNKDGKRTAVPKEELRINYVALTRARHELVLPKNMHDWVGGA
ncbi:MAG: hypothetical protein RIS70_3681 [Planctomycetota bacterium]